MFFNHKVNQRIKIIYIQLKENLMNDLIMYTR